MNGEFWRYAIASENKLQSVNVYEEHEQEELNKRIAELNKGSDVKAHWPHPQDPEVLALLDDPNFHPIETQPGQTLDKLKSFLVYEQIELTDEYGVKTGSVMDGDIDPQKSVLVYKDVQVPVRPSDVKVRMQAAMETVARRRAGVLE